MSPGHRRNSPLAQPTMVHTPPPNAARTTSQHSSHRTVCQVATRSPENAPSGRTPALVGMPGLRDYYLRQGFSASAATTMVNARRNITYKQYESYLSAWFEHCRASGINPRQPTLQQAINFMDQVRSARQLGYSAVNTMRSALSSVIIDTQNISFGLRPEVKLFMKGTFNSKPPVPKYVDTWDPDRVLTFLKQWSPAARLDLKKLTLKVLVLALLVSGQRIQTLHAVDTTFMKMTHSSVSFVIPSLLKQSRPGYTNPKIVLKAYAPDRRICVFTYVSKYLEITSTLRGDTTALFLTLNRPHGPASKDTMARWVREVLTQSGIDTTVYGPHSVRSASTSAAKKGGASVQNIMDTAGWTRASTFARYYDKSLPSVDFADAVLDRS